MKTWSPRVSTDLNSEPLPWDENLFQKKIQGMKVGWILLDELVFLEGPAYGFNLAAPNGDNWTYFWWMKDLILETVFSGKSAGESIAFFIHQAKMGVDHTNCGLTLTGILADHGINDCRYTYNFGFHIDEPMDSGILAYQTKPGSRIQRKIWGSRCCKISARGWFLHQFSIFLVTL